MRTFGRGTFGEIRIRQIIREIGNLHPLSRYRNRSSSQKALLLVLKVSRPGTPIKMNARWIVSCVLLMLVASSVATKLAKPHSLSTQMFKPQGSACEVCVGFITTDINMIIQAIMGTAIL